MKCKFITKIVWFRNVFFHFFQSQSRSILAIICIFFSPPLSFKWGFYLFPQYSIFLASYICIVSIAPCSPRGGERINKQDILFCDLWKQFNLEQKRKRNWKLQITIWSWSRELRNHIMIKTKFSLIKSRRWNMSMNEYQNHMKIGSLVSMCFC